VARQPTLRFRPARFHLGHGTGFGLDARTMMPGVGSLFGNIRGSFDLGQFVWSQPRGAGLGTEAGLASSPNGKLDWGLA